MKIINVEKSIVSSFCSLDVSFLDKLDGDIIYSYNYKHEMIAELGSVFEKIKSKGINKLIVKDSACKYCYPKGKAFSFHHPKTDEFIIRYVIFKEKDDFFIVEECKNNPIINTEDGMPF